MNNKKKITIRYFLYILGGAVLGACLSLVCFHAKIPFENLFSDLYTRLLASSPWLCILLGLSAVVLCYVPLAKAKKRIADWNGWNDDTDDTFYRKTEVLLNISIGISSLAMMLYFMAFALLTII